MIPQQPPTYELSASSLSVNEGESVTITLSTTNVDEDVEVTYVLTNIEDLGIEKSLGTFKILANGTASVTFAPISDFLLEGLKTFSLELSANNNVS